METFSSEIGKKMRSAVKAKLIELGTEGGTSGYVDDELPDYVMIMVANKRSKQQMTSDLTLFLGHKTELFVTWLHEVLQKLQEVTIPAPAAKKRKSSQKEEISSKKDKKVNKKDKKPAKKSTELVTEKTTATTETTASVTLPPTGSITDAFAEELLEKAKHNLDATADAASQIKKGKTKKPTAAEETRNQTGTKEGNVFDIPTISEISSTTGSGSVAITTGNRQKDLAELAEIQKKIYAAKKHLKELGELKDLESEDEDFLRLREEGSSDELSENNNANEITEKQDKTKPATKEKSPIVFDKDKPERGTTPPARSRGHSPQPLSSAAVKTARNNFSEQRPLQASRAANARESHIEPTTQRSRDRERREATPHRRSIHERLGAKPQNNDTRRREKELYIPAHRRQEMKSVREQVPERWRSRERNERRNEREDVEKSLERSTTRQATLVTRVERVERQPEKSPSLSEEETESSPITRHRVGSRVIVAPVKPVSESSDEEKAIDKPVNSVIKIKPRPPVSPSRQACKNLLLRAVAEAQRSTILAKSKTAETKPSGQVKARLGSKTVEANHSEIFTKTLRERRLKRSATSITASALFRRQAQNFIVQVDGKVTAKRRRRDDSQSPQHSDTEDQYLEDYAEDEEASLSVSLEPLVKESVGFGVEETEELEPYISEDEIIDQIAVEKTQFVVTLNDDKATQKYRRHNTIENTRSASPPPQVTSSSSSLRNRSNEPSSTTQFSRSRPRETRRSDIRSRLSKRPATPLSPTRANRLKERESTNSSPSSMNTPPRPTRRGTGSGGAYVEVYRKTKDVKKIIIKNDTDDDELSSPMKQTPEKERKEKSLERRSRTPSLPKTPKTAVEQVTNDADAATMKHKRTPIKYDLDNARSKHDLETTYSRDESTRESKSRERSRSRSLEHQNEEDRRRISIRTEINNKYDNIPALSSISLDSNALRVIKPKERCKYHPNCTKQFCDYYHPTAPCKAFPNCKFADKCLYSHPKCKYDLSCTSLDCNFSHSGPRNPSQLQPTAPPLSSHVVPVQNYKTISATAGASSTMCKYYPNCTKAGCTFYHPKACRFGKNCINKLECNFYHHEVQSSSKFKWVASAT